MKEKPSTAANKKSESDAKSKGSITIHYEKNPMYRNIHVDGAIGGITPHNQINLNFYATRRAIPKSAVYEMLESGQINGPKEISKDSKSGIIREIEIGIYMNRQSASDLYNFLKKIFENGEK